MLDHPFLPTLYAQLTSDNLSCLVMEYCPGNLHVLGQKQPGRNFPEQSARFYGAEALLAMEYLHMLGVVYRDLKPENILAREDGHILLTDFDLSLRCDVNPVLLHLHVPWKPQKFLVHAGEKAASTLFALSQPVKPLASAPEYAYLQSQVEANSLLQLVAEPTEAQSNSFVGSHEYLAPEIIKGDGHGSSVDWWMLGVFLYELLYGKTPFKGVGNDETLASCFAESEIPWHSPSKSFQAQDLIKGLLVKEPEHRLGSERGAAEIKKHPFFEGLN